MKYQKHDILYCPGCQKSERFVIHPAYSECGKCGRKLVRAVRVVEPDATKNLGISTA